MAEKARNESEPIDFVGVVVVVGDRRILRLPAEASAQLPSRGQVAVTGRVGGRAFEAVVEPDGARGHWLDIGGLDAGSAAGSPAGSGSGSEYTEGDAVRVEIARRDDWPEPVLPPDVEEALTAAPAASATWDDITPMARWEWVRWVNATKNPQTRDRRIEVSMSKLGKGMRRPCCFDLSSCTDPDLAKNGKLLGLS